MLEVYHLSLKNQLKLKNILVIAIGFTSLSL